MIFRLVLVFIFLTAVFNFITCDSYMGPDPWDHVKVDTSPRVVDTDIDAPPDLRIPLKRRTQHIGNLGNGEWFFKRALAIMLNGGQIKVNEDGSINISLQMKIDPERWQTLNEYTKSDYALSDELYRRSIAYVEEAIYRPTLTEKIVVAWSEHIQIFLLENKMYFVWCSGILAVTGLLLWLWKHMSHKHLIILILVALYLYEVVISYKEAEKKELESFMAAVKKCSWFFSSCELPTSDLIMFMKHMNPLKIALRMFTTVLSEPLLVISGTVNTIVHDYTDGLWFPFNVILHSALIICINVMLIVLLIMIIFNYILNIPFSLWLGLGSIHLKQRNRTMNFNLSNNNSEPVDNADRISGATLDKIMDVFSRALDSKNTPEIASSGHLPNSSIRKIAPFMSGGGDGKTVKRRFWKGLKKNNAPGKKSV